jgi:hypothetical protein
MYSNFVTEKSKFLFEISLMVLIQFVSIQMTAKLFYSDSDISSFFQSPIQILSLDTDLG